jgi:predicted RNA-binding Zn-ribbon protein involved in translation (DUF1610 family)
MDDRQPGRTYSLGLMGRAKIRMITFANVGIRNRIAAGAVGKMDPLVLGQSGGVLPVTGAIVPAQPLHANHPIGRLLCIFTNLPCLAGPRFEDSASCDKKSAAILLNPLDRSHTISGWIAIGQSVEGDTVMSKSTYFVQECPTCGRSLHIRVEYLGRQLVCQHCGGHLTASDAEGASGAAALTESALMRRADELLQAVARRRAYPR